MNRLKKTVSRFSGLWDIPLDLSSGLPEIRISGMRTLTVEPHRGLRSFSGDCVLVETALGLLCIRGRDLVLKSVSREELRLNGELVSVEMAAAHAD